MTTRVWRASLIAALLVLAGYILGRAQGGALPNLRSQHSRPALRMPARLVAITSEGKTFHRADCPLIHGPVKMVDAQVAAQQGYVPDPRCMHEAVEK